MAAATFMRSSLPPPPGVSSNTFSVSFRSHITIPLFDARPRVSRFKTDIRIKPDKSAKAEPETRICEAPGVIRPGELPCLKIAQESCPNISGYCAAHARAHNEAWDFFKGMGDDDIQRFREEALTGHRPTWPLGKRGAKARMGQSPLGGAE